MVNVILKAGSALQITVQTNAGRVDIVRGGFYKKKAGKIQEKGGGKRVDTQLNKRK